MELVIPQSPGERERAARFIRETLKRNNLRNTWLIQQLKKEGFLIQQSTVCDALSLRMQYPKTDEFLGRAERICRRYARSCFGAERSGN